MKKIALISRDGDVLGDQYIFKDICLIPILLGEYLGYDVLTNMHCQFRSVTHGEMDEGLICANGYDVIVNTTPLGMFPNVDGCPPIDFESIHEGMIVLDLVYNPEATEFMRRASIKEAIATGGIEMLREQAYEAIKLFTIDN